MDNIKCSDSPLFTVLIIVVGSSLLLGVSAQDSTGCISTLSVLTPCFGYLSPGNTSQPSSDCCTPLAQILSSTTSAACLCQAPTLAKAAGISVNETRALELAKQCKQSVPSSVTNCLSASTSTPTSTPSPTPSSTTSPTPTSSPSHSPSSTPSSIPISTPSPTPIATPSPPGLSSAPSPRANGNTGSGSNGGQSDGDILSTPSFFLGFILAVVSSYFVLIV
ncbi:hypothetical protein KP509_12G092300 [Ceratopteris richardii]|uniref:Bifunctional inhibitor/plant lipid transfer protein/seed storage helical domain-containing protein n=1 Tax=Ceratopteris richardii TaxID=49495 RepID=A0A8T2TQX7_CERRI|nr:hypothetical protein KP509_12G092300 [Ceratopteris richardii]